MCPSRSLLLPTSRSIAIEIYKFLLDGTVHAKNGEADSKKL